MAQEMTKIKEKTAANQHNYEVIILLTIMAIFFAIDVYFFFTSGSKW